MKKHLIWLAAALLSLTITYLGREKLGIEHITDWIGLIIFGLVVLSIFMFIMAVIWREFKDWY